MTYDQRVQGILDLIADQKAALWHGNTDEAGRLNDLLERRALDLREAPPKGVV